VVFLENHVVREKGRLNEPCIPGVRVV